MRRATGAVPGPGDVRSYLGVFVGRPRSGQTAGPQRCTPGPLKCRSFTGPDGERVVVADFEGRRTVPRPVVRIVTVVRTDGT
ncbi:hypothetical protein [Micromonospora sp. RP3T]|uniref:hypothetical protein n=1 Tax=Micromonospora sp. RP3T TaxID=2135446 RepID=UPI003D75FFB0